MFSPLLESISYLCAYGICIAWSAFSWMAWDDGLGNGVGLFISSVVRWPSWPVVENAKSLTVRFSAKLTAGASLMDRTVTFQMLSTRWGHLDTRKDGVVLLINGEREVVDWTADCIL